jgi:hypothetical protein
MRYLFIVFLFISSFLSGQGIEPTSLQPTPYKSGVLKGVIPYVDEFTGETLYIYQHVDSLVFIKDSIYVRNDSIFLRDGTGFAIVTDSIYVVTGVSKDTIKLRDGRGYALIDKADQARVRGTGTATRVAWWGGTDSLSSSAQLYWDNSADQLGIGTTSPNTYIYDGYNGLSIYDATSARLGMANINRTWITYLSGNDYRIFNSYFGETFKIDGTNGRWQGGVYASVGTNKAAYFDTNGVLYKSDYDGLDGVGIAGYVARWYDTNSQSTGGLYFPAEASMQMSLGTTTPYVYLLNGTSKGFSIHDQLGDPRFSMSTSTRTWLWYTSSNDLRLWNSNNGEFLHFDDNNRLGINTGTPQRSLHVQGEVRISDLETDVATRLLGADADGDLGAVTVSNGLSIDGSGNLTGNINGTQNRIAKFTSQYAVGNSEIYTIGDTLVGINQSNPQYHLDVTGKFRVTDRTGTAVTGAGFTSNGQLIAYSLDTASATPNTYISSGTDINITGTGTMVDPYTINNSAPENTSVKDGTQIDFSELTNDTITATIIASSIGPTEIAPTSVTPGAYTLSSITVDADGRITSASNGSDAVGVSSIATTSPITGGTITSFGTIGINDAAADGSTKGAAAFTAADFNSSLGLISIDYVNGQAATSMQKGFLTSTDWSTFNGKIGGSGTANYVPKFTGLTTIGNSALYDGGSDQLGIGTTSPNSYIYDNYNGLAIYDATSARFGMANSSSSWLNYLSGSNYRIFNSIWGELATFTSGGRVGINNTAPAYTLDVSGDIRITGLAGSGNRMVIAGSSGDLSTQTIPTGTVTSVGITPGSGISVSGSPITSSGNITVNNTGDLSNTNELQTLSFSSPNLSITSGNFVTLPVLPSGSTNQTLRHDGSSWAATSGVTVTSGNRMDINSWPGTVNLGSKLLVNGHIQYTNTGFAATTLTGRDGDGGLTSVGVGSGLSLSGGTLSSSTIFAEVYGIASPSTISAGAQAVTFTNGQINAQGNITAGTSGVTVNVTGIYKISFTIQVTYPTPNISGNTSVSFSAYTAGGSRQTITNTMPDQNSTDAYVATEHHSFTQNLTAGTLIQLYVQKNSGIIAPQLGDYNMIVEKL